MLESTRAKEAAVKKETAEQLEEFRRQREAAEKAALGELDVEIGDNSASGDTWTTNSKKRRRGPLKEGPGTKVRRTSSTIAKDSSPDDEDAQGLPKEAVPIAATIQEDVKETKSSKLLDSPAKPGTVSPVTQQNQVSIMGLGAYSSEED